MIGPRIERSVGSFLSGLAYPFSSAGRTVAFGVVAVATYVLLVLSSFPTYSIQLLGADPTYLGTAVVSLTANTYATVGAIGLGLVVAYAALTGVAITVTVERVRQRGLSGTGGLSTTLPGFLVAGCASCGAGVLGLVGFAGALATLPFHGNLLRAGGLLLLVWYLARVGDPRNCAVSPAGD